MSDTEILAYTDSRITELEKENAGLKLQLATSEHDREHNDYELSGTYETIEKLKAQIEKMKCCGNCSKSCFVQDCEDIVNRCDCATSDSLLFKCGEWELAE